jgi:ABC-type phosphate transport system auxiliary subunit
MLSNKELQSKKKKELIEYCKSLQGMLAKAGEDYSGLHEENKELSKRITRLEGKIDIKNKAYSNDIRDLTDKLEVTQRYHEIATNENSKIKALHDTERKKLERTCVDLEQKVVSLENQSRKLLDIAAALAKKGLL